MFQHLSYRAELRPAVPVPGVENVDVPNTIDDRTGGMVYAVRVTGRTLGTLSVRVFCSATGNPGSYFRLGSGYDLGPLAANGFQYVYFKEATTRFVRFELTPAGAFDGNVQVLLFSSDLINSQGIG